MDNLNPEPGEFRAYKIFNKYEFDKCFQYLISELGSRSRSRGRSEPGVFGSLGAGAALKKNQEPEPEPLGKNLGAGATKKLAGSSALLEDKNIKEIVLLLLIFR